MRTRRRGTVIRALVIVIALVAVLALVRRVPDPEAAPSASVGPTVTASPASSSSGPGTPSTDATPAPRSASPASGWQRTATTFVTAYSTTTGGQTAWLARLRPLVSPEVYRGFGYTDLSNLPGGTPGAGRVLLEDAYAGGTMRFPLSGSTVWGVDVTVGVGADGRDVVTRVLPASSAEAAS